MGLISGLVGLIPGMGGVGKFLGGAEKAIAGAMGLPALDLQFGKNAKGAKGEKGSPKWLETALGAAGAGLGAATEWHGYSPEEEEAARYKYSKKTMDDRRQMLKDEGIKPTNERVEYWSGLKELAPFVQASIMGSFKDIIGEEALSKWGAGAGITPQGGSPPSGPGAPGAPPIYTPGPYESSGKPMPEEGYGFGGRPMPPWMQGRGGGPQENY